MNIKIAATAIIVSLWGWNGIDVLRAEQADGENVKIESDGRKYFDSSNDFRKKADQARVDGRNDLADVLIKCAEARQKMGEACKSGKKDDFAVGLNDYTEAQKELTALDATEQTGVKDKATRMKETAAKYEKAATDFEKKAKELGDEDPMSAIYSKLAAAYHKVAEGYKTGHQDVVNAGFDDYKNAQKERDRLNKSKDKEKKKVKKAVIPEEKPVPAEVAPTATNVTVAPTGKPTNKLPEYKLD